MKLTSKFKIFGNYSPELSFNMCLNNSISRTKKGRKERHITSRLKQISSSFTSENNTISDPSPILSFPKHSVLNEAELWELQDRLKIGKGEKLGMAKNRIDSRVLSCQFLNRWCYESITATNFERNNLLATHHERNSCFRHPDLGKVYS